MLGSPSGALKSPCLRVSDLETLQFVYPFGSQDFPGIA